MGEVFNLRLEDEVHTRLKTEARRTSRTMAGMVRHTINEYFERQDTRREREEALNDAQP